MGHRFHVSTVDSAIWMLLTFLSSPAGCWLEGWSRWNSASVAESRTMSGRMWAWHALRDPDSTGISTSPVVTARVALCWGKAVSSSTQRLQEVAAVSIPPAPFIASIYVDRHNMSTEQDHLSYFFVIVWIKFDLIKMWTHFHFMEIKCQIFIVEKIFSRFLNCMILLSFFWPGVCLV